MKKHIFILLLLLNACVMPAAVPSQTALQTRSIQTKEYLDADPKLVMRAVLDVLQDEGFVTKNAVVDLGLITASREEQIRGSLAWTFGAALAGHEPRFPTTKVIEATANVSEFGKTTRVRVSFATKVLDNRGAVMDSHAVLDAKSYQEFFGKIDKGIFIGRSGV